MPLPQETSRAVERENTSEVQWMLGKALDLELKDKTRALVLPIAGSAAWGSHLIVK